jgi:hypothetical protein
MQDNNFAQSVIKETIKRLRGTYTNLRTVGRRGHITVPIPNSDEEITLQFQICFHKLLMVRVTFLLKPQIESFVGLDMTDFDHTKFDEAVEKCFMDLSEIVVGVSETIEEDKEETNEEKTKEEKEKPTIKKVTQSSVLDTKEISVLAISLDNGSNVILHVPSNLIHEFKEGSLVIDHGGMLTPYQKPQYLN